MLSVSKLASQFLPFKKILGVWYFENVDDVFVTEKRYRRDKEAGRGLLCHPYAFHLNCYFRAQKMLREKPVSSNP